MDRAFATNRSANKPNNAMASAGVERLPARQKEELLAFLAKQLGRSPAVRPRTRRGLSVTAPLRTCEAVLTEAAYLLGTPEPVLQMLADGDLTADFQAETHVADLLRWLDKFADLDPGFADACVVKLGELYPRAEILTTDRGDLHQSSKSWDRSQPWPSS